jgi:hypothetical protein
MSKIFLSNTINTDVLTDSMIPLNGIERRTGCVFSLNNGELYINQCGYYLVIADITFVAPTAGNAIITIQKNNIDVQSMLGAETITTATTETRTITISGIIRVFPNDIPAKIRLFNQGIGITTTNVNLTAIKIG